MGALFAGLALCRTNMAGCLQHPLTTCPYFTSDTVQLILTRHGKSSWDDLSLDDHDRPLNARGKKAARAIGHWLKASNYVPDQVLCSTAMRAQETYVYLCEGLQVAPQRIDLEALYLASPDTILAQIKCHAMAPSVLVIGHNPGFADLAMDLVEQAPEHPDFYRFPTAATLVAAVTADSWPRLRRGVNTVQDFAIPRELAEDSDPLPH